MSKYQIVSFLWLAALVTSSITQTKEIAVYASLVFLCLTILGVYSLRFAFFGNALTRIKHGSEKTVYLTFDDGPDPDTTPEVLALLDKYSYTATFFVVAQKVQKHPEILRQIQDAGHCIASHDWHHQWWSNFRVTLQMYTEIGRSLTIIESITGERISLYRPPVGLSNPSLFVALRKLNLSCVGWNRSVRDGGNRIERAIRKISSLATAPNGSIILLHDTAPNEQRRTLFLQELARLLEKLHAQGRKSEALPLSAESV